MFSSVLHQLEELVELILSHLSLLALSVLGSKDLLLSEYQSMPHFYFKLVIGFF